MRIPLRQFLHDGIHLFTWFSPWCPEVDQGYSVEVRREEILEVVGRFDDMESGHEGVNKKFFQLQSQRCRNYEAL